MVFSDHIKSDTRKNDFVDHFDKKKTTHHSGLPKKNVTNHLENFFLKYTLTLTEKNCNISSFAVKKDTDRIPGKIIKKRFLIKAIKIPSRRDNLVYQKGCDHHNIYYTYYVLQHYTVIITLL